MICSHCKTPTVEWKGPLTALTHTECSNCGRTNCQITEPEEEGDECPHCGGAVEIEEPDNCSCHISPPCGACTSAGLECPECGEVFRDDD